MSEPLTPITEQAAIAPDEHDRGPWMSRLLSSGAGRNLGLIIALLVLFAIGWWTGGGRFANVDNFLTIVRYASIVGVVSIGMTFVIIGGGIDLSVGSVVGLTSVVASLAAVQAFSTQTSWIVMVVVALAVGVIAGLVNGVVIAYGNVVAFMATLAMLVAARGLAEIVSGKRTQIVSAQGFLEVFRSNILGIPILIWIFAIVAVLGWLLLNRTTFGRRTVAIGGNREAARLAGLKVKRHTMYLYALSGLTAGIAGDHVPRSHDGRHLDPRHPDGARRHRGGRCRRHAAHRWSRVDRRHGVRRADLRHPRQCLHPEQPRRLDAEHHEGRDHRDRRALQQRFAGRGRR